MRMLLDSLAAVSGIDHKWPLRKIKLSLIVIYGFQVVGLDIIIYHHNIIHIRHYRWTLF